MSACHTSPLLRARLDSPSLSRDTRCVSLSVARSVTCPPSWSWLQPRLNSMQWSTHVAAEYYEPPFKRSCTARLKSSSQTLRSSAVLFWLAL